MNKTVNVGLIFKNSIGIVSEVSRKVFNNGGNITQSSMMKLGNHFAFDLTATFPDKTKTQMFAREMNYKPTVKSLIGTNVHGLESSAINGHNIFNTSGNYMPILTDDTYRSRIKLYSSDNPGIIHSTSEKLESLNADIISLKSTVTPAPFSSGPLFSLVADFNINRDISKEMIKETMEDVVNKYNCDIDIE